LRASTTGDKDDVPTPVNVEKELPKGKYNNFYLRKIKIKNWCELVMIGSMVLLLIG